jgi:hypothetical protein
MMSKDEQEKKASRLRWKITPPKWLSDTYKPILFWSSYYEELYNLPFNPFE